MLPKITTPTHTVPTALLSAVTALQAISERNLNHTDWLNATGEILVRLIATDDWLPASHAQSHPQYYQQHKLHVDPAERFSLSSFVWGPSQGTPVHNHTVPGWVGVLRGGELCQNYSPDGQTKMGEETRLNPGDIAAVTPHDDAIGDVHTVRNAFNDRDSISIHLYRGDIATLPRSVFKDGLEKPFQSGYSSAAAFI